VKRKSLLYVTSVEKEPMMQGKTSILHFAIQVCEISYILERPDGVCSVHLKNGNVIVVQESFETVTEAYEKIAKHHFEFQKDGLVDAPLEFQEDLGSRTIQVRTHGLGPEEVND